MKLNLTGTQTLETERLILRRFEEGDAEAMFRNWASDEEVTRFLLWNTHADVNTSKRVLADWLAARADPLNYQWAIVPKEAGEPVGSISLMNFQPEHFRAEAGYCLGRPWWGRGLMTEALKAVITYSFDTVGLNRVEAFHDVENPASGRVMQKSGMRHEGTFRQWRHTKGRFCDYDFYAILREDYFKQNP